MEAFRDSPNAVRSQCFTGYRKHSHTYGTCWHLRDFSTSLSSFCLGAGLGLGLLLNRGPRGLRSVGVFLAALLVRHRRRVFRLGAEIFSAHRDTETIGRPQI